MKIRHKFFEDEKLFIQKAYGEWSTEVYIKHVEAVICHEEMLNTNKLISDMRDIDMSRAVADMDKIVGLRDTFINLDYTHVFIVDAPMSTAVTHLYIEGSGSSSSNLKFCSTINEAIRLLQLDMGEDEMEARFKNLKS